MRWFGTAGGLSGLATVADLACPVLYIYGERKLFMFHSPEWIAQLKARPGSAVQALPTGHWVMLDKPEAFRACVRAWLDAGGVPACKAIGA
ncbi:alpha/beta fold hydrolase [Pseudorhodoferax sp. Leaf267]|uniref:alpha/beta fold hydrolase n=1 Tax=Pseudorhodoferax sp. Leaf267 TaxID=1736316 RepID=UPI0012E31CE3|nr:alpha/beta hydrolase [Pseudorhodoferax sp. Leaf267]